MTEEIFGELEFPKHNCTINKVVIHVQGWALSSLGNDVEISFYIDNDFIGKTWPGIARFDILQKLPNIKGAYESGFFFQLDLSKMNNGNHSLKAIAKTEKSEKLLGNIIF